MSILSAQLIDSGDDVAAAAGSNRVVAILAGRESNSTTTTPGVSALTWGSLSIGAGITLGATASQGSGSSARTRASTYYVREADIPIGSQAMAIVYDVDVGTSETPLTVVTLGGRDQATPIDNTATVVVLAGASGEPITGTIAVVNDADVVVAGCWNNTRAADVAAGPLTVARDTSISSSAARRFDQVGNVASAATVTFGVTAFSPANNSGTLAAVSFAPAAAVTPPTKTAATVDDASATAYTLGAEYTQDCTEYAVAMPVGTADPNAAAIVAGTGATGTASNAQTADTPDTYTLTPSQTPKHPLYDIHRIARNAGGDSAITRHYDQALDPPDGKQFVTASGLPWGPSITAVTSANPPEFTVDADIVALFWETGDTVWLWNLTGDWAALNATFSEPAQDFLGRTITVTGTNTFTVAVDASAFGAFTSGGFAAVDRSLLEGATPAVVDGDVMVAPLVTTPGSFPFTLNADGTWGYDSGGSSAPQSIEFDVFDYSGQDYYGAVTVYLRDSEPVVNPDLSPEDFQFRRVLGSAPLVIDLLEYLIDPDDDPLVFTLSPASVNSLEDVGGSFDETDSNLFTLDPAVAIWGASIRLRGTTPSGQYREFTFEVDYGPAITDISGDDEATATAALEGQGFTVALGTPVYDSDIAAGLAARTVPPAGAIAEFGSLVVVQLSLGPVAVISEILIDETGTPRADLTGISVLIWRSTAPSGAPDVTLTDQVTDGDGLTAWGFDAQPLEEDEPVFYLAYSGSPPDSFTAGLVIPTLPEGIS